MTVNVQAMRGEWALAAGGSDLGAIAVAVCDGAVSCVEFGHAAAAAAVASAAGRLRAWYACTAGATTFDRDLALAEELLGQLQQYAAGELVDFAGVRIAVDHLSPFQRRVIKACRAIERGERRTYGQLAAAAGSPGAARAVGQVMAGNRTPLVVPCHRVVAAGGLGGFSARDGLTMKRRLLALEADTAAAV